MTRHFALAGAGVALLCWQIAAQTAPTLDGPAFSLQRQPLQQVTSPETTTSTPAADPAQIERLLAGQQLKPAAPNTQADADAAAEIATCLARNIRALDPANPKWNETDPRWEPMRQTIMRDCAARREFRIRSVQSELQRMYRDALANSYAQHLSRADAESLLRFYSTDTGRRFLAFQNRLTAIEFDSMQKALVRAAPDGGVGASTPALSSVPAPAPDVVKRRAAILLMARQTLLMMRWQQDATKSGGDSSGWAVAPIIMNMATTMEGEAIDQIEKEYARDLPAFSAFLSWPAEQHEIRALADAQMSFGTASATQLIKLAPEWNGDLQKWREQYRALSPALPVSPASGARGGSAPASK